MDRHGTAEDALPTMKQRIEERRAALDAKMKAAKRLPGGDAAAKNAADKADTAKEGRGEAQVRVSRAELAHLKATATEAVTQYRVTTDHSEMQRRIREEAEAGMRVAKVKEDTDLSRETHLNIQLAFGKLLDHNPAQKLVPQELMKDLQAQRDLCKNVIDVKDKLIEELRRQMIGKEEQYVAQLKKQADDIDRLIETMHTQTETLVAAYHRELTSIEDAYVQERRELLATYDKEIEALVVQRGHREREQVKKREQKVWDAQKILDDKYEENAEKFNKSKMDSLHDIHGLGQELEYLKANFMLNQEKLTYNLRVLNERVNENKKASELHRKKLGRLQDVLSTLLAKYAESDKKFQLANRELTESYRRVTEQYKDLQLKFQHFEKADVEKYQAVWKMHEDECMKLVHKCLLGDRVVFEELLGVKWTAPSLDFWLDNSAAEMQSSSAAVEAETMAKTQEADRTIGDLGDAANTMLHIIYTQVPFLVEEKVRRVIDQMEESESYHVKVDAVLSALEIKQTEEARQLLDYFMADSDDGQPAMINPQEVVRALQRFLHDRAAKRDTTISRLDLSKLESQQQDQKKKDAEALQRERQREFWTRMSNVVPESHLRLWRSMESAAGKYLKQLQKRQKLIASTDALRQQNDELRQLLNTYLGSAVNDELFCPPQLQVVGGAVVPSA